MKYFATLCYCYIDDTATVRVTNLSEETKEQDLRDLFGHFGPIHRVYLAKDKTMQRSKVTTPPEIFSTV